MPRWCLLHAGTSRGGASTPGRERLADNYRRRVVEPQHEEQRRQLAREQLEDSIQQGKQRQADAEFGKRRCDRLAAACDELDPTDDKFRSSPHLQKLHGHDGVSQQQQQQGQPVCGELLQGLDLDGPAETAASDRFEHMSAGEMVDACMPVFDQ